MALTECITTFKRQRVTWFFIPTVHWLFILFDSQVDMYIYRVASLLLGLYVRLFYIQLAAAPALTIFGLCI